MARRASSGVDERGTMTWPKAEQRLAEFRAHGPFSLATVKNSHGREVDRRALRVFGNHRQCQALAERSGCYVFAVRTSKRHISYYVGQTGVGFTRECFTPRKPTSLQSSTRSAR